MARKHPELITPEFLESLNFTTPQRNAVGCMTYTHASTDQINIVVMLYPDDSCEAFLRFTHLHGKQSATREIPNVSRYCLAHLVLGFTGDGKIL